MTKMYDTGKETTSTVSTVKRQSYGTKGRSATTYQNKLRKITKFYNRLFKKSQKTKTKYGSLSNDSKRKKPFFCDRYPTLDDFLKVNQIKKPNKN